MILFNGQIIASTKENNKNHIVKFEQININLSNLETTIIKKPKIQETSTIKLIGCLFNNYFNDNNCRGGLKKEILPVLNRRIVFPLFFPALAFLISFILIRSRKFYFNKFSVFGYCFLVLLFAELVIRYTGLNQVLNSIFILFTIILSIIAYFFLKLRFSKELIK